MTTEEKAKAYDEALEMAKNVLETDLHESGAWAIKKIFPELKESEDERIRKFLVELVSNDKANNFRGFYDIRKIDFDNILAWLEKQKINTEGDFGRGYDCGYKACLNSHGAEFFEKQKEQKPADLVEEAYIENRNDGTHTCATTKDGFDAFMDGFNKGYELGIKEQTKKQ